MTFPDSPSQTQIPYGQNGGFAQALVEAHRQMRGVHIYQDPLPRVLPIRHVQLQVPPSILGVSTNNIHIPHAPWQPVAEQVSSAVH
jgi:hypothetical protein